MSEDKFIKWNTFRNKLTKRAITTQKYSVLNERYESICSI